MSERTIPPADVSFDFIDKLYPRLIQDDATNQRGNYYAAWVDHRLWTVRPDHEHGGWIGKVLDARSGTWSETGWGFKPKAVLLTFQMWGLNYDEEWSVHPLEPTRQEMVYLLGSPCHPLVKIGRAIDVDQRVAEIQRMSPAPLKLIATIPGGARLEARLHRAFAHRRGHGEWFNLLDGDTSDIVPTITEAVRQELNCG